MNTQDSIELFETRKKIIKNFVASHNGVRRVDVQNKLGLKDTFTADLLTRVVRLGEIYRFGRDKPQKLARRFRLEAAPWKMVSVLAVERHSVTMKSIAAKTVETGGK